MSTVYDSATGIAVGFVLAALGWWGVRNAALVVPATLPEAERHRRERVLSRGAITCLCLAVAFTAWGVFRAFP